MTMCACGCGVEILPNRGRVPRFVRGHNGRKHPVGTKYVNSWVNGKQASLHRNRAEKALGKPLPPGAEVHHADGSRRPNAPLVICQDHAYHMLLHRLMRVRALGGNPHTDVICKSCRKPVPKSSARAVAAGKWEQWLCPGPHRRRERVA